MHYKLFSNRAAVRYADRRAGPGRAVVGAAEAGPPGHDREAHSVRGAAGAERVRHPPDSISEAVAFTIAATFTVFAFSSGG